VLTAEAELNDHSLRMSLKVERNLNPYRASELKAMFQIVQDPTIDDVEADEALRYSVLTELSVNLNGFFVAESNCVTYKECRARDADTIIMDMVHKLECRMSVPRWDEIRAISNEFRTRLKPYLQRTMTPKWLDHV
jgi:hypothetical protein